MKDEISAIASSTPSVPAREIGVVTAEIKELCRQAQKMALMYAIEIGRRLVEAKGVLAHGEWGEWLKTEVEFSQSAANNFMKLYEEYGSAQISIFGAIANSQTFENLPYTKALQLLAVPAEDREEFAKKVGAEDISVRELQAAIKERNKAIEEVAAANERREELEQAVAHAEISRDAAEKRAAEAERLRLTVDSLQSQVNASIEREKKLRDKLKAAEADPKVPPEKIKAIRDEVEAEAKKNAENASAAALEEAKQKALEAESEKNYAVEKAKKAEEQLRETQGKLKTANPDIAAFKALFDSMQETAAKLKKSILKIKESDPETAGKLAAALKAFGGSL